MTAGALLFVDSGFVPLVVMVAIAAMLIVTIKQITSSKREIRGEDPEKPPAYISSSSDPHGFHTERPVPGLPLTTTPVEVIDDEQAPVDMTLYDPDAYDDRPRTNLAIATYEFRGFNAEVGPADKDCFYDQITVEIYDHDTASRWHTKYYIATPRGLEKLMRDERWNAMSGEGHLIVPRYDLQNILEAILRHMNNAWEAPSTSPTGGEWQSG